MTAISTGKIEELSELDLLARIVAIKDRLNGFAEMKAKNPDMPEPPQITLDRKDFDAATTEMVERVLSKNHGKWPQRYVFFEALCIALKNTTKKTDFALALKEVTVSTSLARAQSGEPYVRLEKCFKPNI